MTDARHGRQYRVCAQQGRKACHAPALGAARRKADPNEGRRQSLKAPAGDRRGLPGGAVGAVANIGDLMLAALREWAAASGLFEAFISLLCKDQFTPWDGLMAPLASEERIFWISGQANERVPADLADATGG